MESLEATGVLDIGDARLEYGRWGPTPSVAPTIVLLHEGLGCLGLWGDFPARLAAATGVGVFGYSRAGYGASSPVALPRRLTYMHEEALDILPSVLAAIGFRRGILVGHSDGASIAAIYAGGVQDHRVRGLSLIAPHFFTEDVGIAEIARAKIAYEAGDLKPKLARWQANVDNAFRGWNDAWLDPEFRKWDIREYLAYIRVPVQILQGADDQYGTIRQIEAAEAECYCPVDVMLLPGARHAPHREAPDATLAAMVEFVDRILKFHHEGDMESAA
jgi:pimeloyl-ACP methyl ester carboxylesterase